MYTGTSGGQGGSGRKQSCEYSGQAIDRMSLPFLLVLCFNICMYVCMMMPTANYSCFAAFICMNINEVHWCVCYILLNSALLFLSLQPVKTTTSPPAAAPALPQQTDSKVGHGVYVWLSHTL